MKILIVHQYFNTPVTGGPLRSYYLARGLKANGYDVEIITAHNQKHAVTRLMEGYCVHYLPVFYDNQLNFASRLIAFLKFAWLAYRRAKKIQHVDLCYAISTPLSVGWVATRLKATRGIPFIFEVGDLWPEAPVQMGIIKWPYLINAARKFEKSIYLQAESVVALSPGIREGIIKSAPECKVAVIPNMSDCQFFQMEAKRPLLEDRFGVKGKFVITYFGAAGRANHLEYMVDAAHQADRTNRSLHFLVVAKGSELNRLKQMARKLRLENLDFLPYTNRAELKEVLNVTDAVYVSYAPIPVLATGSPNKYFDGLAAGKLMLINFEGWLKSIIEQHEIGYFVDPEKPEMLSQVLEPLLSDRALLQRSQTNARVIAETFFSKALAIQKLLQVLGHHQHQSPTMEPEVYTLTA